MLAINILDQPSELESVFCHLPTKLSIGGNIGAVVGLGTKVCVAVGVSVIVGNENVGRGRGVFVGIALCVSASPMLTVAMAVSMISASLVVGVDWPLPQDVSIAASNKRTRVMPKMFIFTTFDVLEGNAQRLCSRSTP